MLFPERYSAQRAMGSTRFGRPRATGSNLCSTSLVRLPVSQRAMSRCPAFPTLEYGPLHTLLAERAVHIWPIREEESTGPHDGSLRGPNPQARRRSSPSRRGVGEGVSMGGAGEPSSRRVGRSQVGSASVECKWRGQLHQIPLIGEALARAAAREIPVRRGIPVRESGLPRAQRRLRPAPVGMSRL